MAGSIGGSSSSRRGNARYFVCVLCMQGFHRGGTRPSGFLLLLFRIDSRALLLPCRNGNSSCISRDRLCCCSSSSAYWKAARLPLCRCTYFLLLLGCSSAWTCCRSRSMNISGLFLALKFQLVFAMGIPMYLLSCKSCKSSINSSSCCSYPSIHSLPLPAQHRLMMRCSMR